MKFAISKNRIDAKLLEKPLSDFTSNSEFVVSGIKDNSAYEKKLLAYLRNINEPYSLVIQLAFCLFIRIGELKALMGKY